MTSDMLEHFQLVIISCSKRISQNVCASAAGLTVSAPPIKQALDLCKPRSFAQEAMLCFSPHESMIMVTSFGKKNVGSFETFSAHLSWLHPMLWVCQQSWVAVILQRPSKTWTISCTCFITAFYSLQPQHLDQCSGQDFKKKHKCHNKIAHEASLRKKLWTKALLPHQGHCQHQSRSTSTQPIFQAPCFHIIRSCEIAGDLKAHPGAVAPKILSKKLSQVAWLELRAVIAIGLGRFNQKNDP